MATVVKIGWNQVNKPAPLWYRRLTNAMIIVAIPAFLALCEGWGGLSLQTLHRIGLLTAFFSALLKAGGLILGNGQIYSPSNETIDKDKAA